MELAAAGLAAERATPDDLARLTDVLHDMEHSTDNPTEFIDADVRFHLEIARIAGNSVLQRMLSSIRSLLEVWIRRASGTTVAVGETLAEHRRIVDAISSHDRDFAIHSSPPIDILVTLIKRKIARIGFSRFEGVWRRIV